MKNAPPSPQNSCGRQCSITGLSFIHDSLSTVHLAETTQDKTKTSTHPSIPQLTLPESAGQMLPGLLLGFSIATLDLMAGRREDGLTFFFELILLELLSASPQPLTAALHPHWPSPCLLAVLEWQGITHASSALLSGELNLPAARLN